MLPEPTKRIRWLTHGEAEALIAECPPHLADMVRFSLATGLRERNVTGLEWSQIDLVRRVAWVHPDQIKNCKALGVPLNRDAVLVLRRWLGKHATRVFCYPLKRGEDIIWTPFTRLTPQPGERSWNGPGSRISGGTTCGTPGPRGMYSQGHHCTPSRRWEAGRPPRWPSAMRTWHRNICPSTPPASRRRSAHFRAHQKRKRPLKAAKSLI